MKRRRTTARRKLQVINHAKSPAGRCRTPLQGLITTPSVARDFSHEKLVIAVISDGRKRKENETSDESSEQPLHFVLAPTFPFKIEGHPNETDKTRICHFPGRVRTHRRHEKNGRNVWTGASNRTDLSSFCLRLHVRGRTSLTWWLKWGLSAGTDQMDPCADDTSIRLPVEKGIPFRKRNRSHEPNELLHL